MSKYFRVGAFSPNVHIGNPMANAKEILDLILNVEELRQCDLVVTPELSLTGYTCQDLFNGTKIYTDTNKALEYLINNMPDDILLSVGVPYYTENAVVHNTSLILTRGKMVQKQNKRNIPNYKEYYEARWFTPGNNNLNILDITNGSAVIGSEICEDLWAPNPPSTELALAGANLIINNSASNETIGKADYRRQLVKMQSAKCICAYVYCSAGMMESTQDVVFGGHNIIAENGKILAESDLFDDNYGIITADIDLNMVDADRDMNKTFVNNSVEFRKANKDRITRKEYFLDLRHYIKYNREPIRKVSITPFVPENNKLERSMSIYNMQVAGLATRLKKTGSKHLVIGVSGGLDSTLALLVAHSAVKKAGMSATDVVGLTMPCFGTTSRTLENSLKLMEALHCESHKIDITDGVKAQLRYMGINENATTVAFENAQARERTQLLMDYANNIGGFVVGTGDLSEQALGWATYNGDHMSMYNPNGSIPKTLVRTLVEMIGNKLAVNNPQLKEVIQDILDTPISPELLKPSKDGTIQQLTEDSVGPYVLNDFFIYYHVRYGFNPKTIYELAQQAVKQSKDYKFSNAEIKKWLMKFYKRFFKAQFKRNVCPDGVKVGSVSFNPRGDWRMASEVDYNSYIEEVENLPE